jgi:hypothetical protein
MIGLPSLPTLDLAQEARIWATRPSLKMVNSTSMKSADLWPLWGWWWWQAKRTLANSCPNDIDEFMEDVIRSISESHDRRRKCAPVPRRACDGRRDPVWSLVFGST